jgi:hypothetical protein
MPKNPNQALPMSEKRFADFLNGFAAANQLMNRAGENGCFVEFVCLATSIVDALLRIGLILKHQLNSRSSEVSLDLIFQSDHDKIISERMIYQKAIIQGIISQEQFTQLEELYKRRNKVIHRYIISEITTDQVLQIAFEYQAIIDVIGNQVRQLEDQQIESGIGMTRSGKQVPFQVKIRSKSHIQEMADKKHDHPKLAENLKKSTRNTNGN